MKVITSRANENLKKICQLHVKKGRDAQRLFIAEGVRTIQTLLKSSLTLQQLYVTQEHDAVNCPENLITQVTPEVMKKISLMQTNDGYLAVFEIPRHDLKLLDRGIVLAQISDPGNMGTLIRTAAALAMPTVVIVEGSDPWSPKVVQATAGTIGLVKIIECSWSELVKAAQQKTLCALVVDGGAQPTTVPADDYFLVIGNEAHGIPEAWRNDCAQRITIPMPGNTESLNAAVAGSIAMYIATHKS